MALVIADGLISQFLVKSSLGREINPLLGSLVGQPVFIALKVFGAALCAFILWDINKRRPRLALIATFCFIAVYGGIVLWNLASLFISKVQ